ncbi:hypothetical protein FDB50_15375 [Clostridium botulinum]|uniref:Uncharacterized protein n=1 Tax=Clostridium botulinum TaxID=1491 RepID=A0A846JT46_CLOBO|nr:hypothetical protein [Clostridium botulinum]NFN36420.1 hypothetical protein [Clostridium botulinum]
MEVVMSHKQFLEWKYGDKTTIDIKLENLGIKNKMKLEKTLVIGLAIGGFLINHPTTVFALELDEIDKLGNTFLEIIRKASYWVILAVAITDICKTSLKGGNNNSEIFKLIVRYVLIYSSLFLMPYLFDLVEGAFK